MDIKYRLYPHPVLWDKNDDYNTSFFDCNIELLRDVKRIILQTEFTLKNDELKNLIERGQAEYILHIESPASSYRLISTSASESKRISLADEHLLGKVSLCPFIVAKMDIENFINSDFNADYAGVSFNISKGTILAIGTQQIFKVDKENEDLSKVPSIFTVYKSETVDEIPIEIEVNSEKIRIGLNITDYQNYYASVQDKPSIVNAFLIYPALIFAFERLKDGFSDYSEYRWFQALEKMFKKYDMELNEDLLAAKTSLELSQKVMHFPISKALNAMMNFEDNGGDDE